jgi:hypothetical protein
MHPSDLHPGVEAVRNATVSNETAGLQQEGTLA